MYNGAVDRIFSLAEDERLRFGNSPCDKACVTARNLPRANTGTRFIQITYGSWDHHQNLYAQLTTMAGIFDAGLARLIADLKSDGLLDETLIVAQGEFGRTVGSLNGNQGRDHYSHQAVLCAGAKTRGGRAVGSSDSSGRSAADPD